MAAPGSIQPDLQELYDWDFKNEEDEVEIVVSFPPTFNTKALKAQLNGDRTAISITVDGQPPIVMGKLFEPVTDMTKSIQSDNVTFTLTKATPQPWPILIKDAHPDTTDLDPRSMLMIAQVMLGQGTNESIEQGQMLLLKGCELGYVPTLMLTHELFAKSEDPQLRDVSVRLLQKAALVYRNPVAMMQLGLIMIGQPETVAEGEQMMLAAAEAGLPIAMSYLGQLYSPLTEAPFPKDVEKAVKLFQAVRELQPDEPIMCHELAKMYYNGVGVELNEELAQELQKRAKMTLVECPELEKIEVKQQEEKKEAEAKKGKFSAVDAMAVVAVGSVILGGAFTLFKMWRKRK